MKFRDVLDVCKAQTFQKCKSIIPRWMLTLLGSCSIWINFYLQYQRIYHLSSR